MLGVYGNSIPPIFASSLFGPARNSVMYFGGTNILKGSVIIKVEKLVEDATYNQLLRLVENTQNTKAPI
jgi:cation transport ATPase